jgi:hypothetical protein
MKLLVVLMCMVCSFGMAQDVNVSGVVRDTTDNSALIGVTVLIFPSSDTTQRKGTVTDVDGKFTFTDIASGNYIVRFSYVGYSTRQIAVNVKGSPVEIGGISLSQSTTVLKAVQVTGSSIQVEQKGDTLQYNANAFKTNRDAPAEDLITKMPGMTSENGTLKAQGENVQKVLVDGKEFFGDDATIALKNLPAEVIEKIEVFDRLSEQSQLTGFDDGQTQKTVNIVTKRGRNQGQFGRLYAGIGEGGRYSAGGNVNDFKGTRKISIVGLTNNINQQNFSNEDLLGINSSNSGGGNGGGRGGRGGGGGGNSGGNFSVGQQSGISTTHSIGLNYSNKLGKKTDVSGSYFFNKSNNERVSNISRQYITSRDSGLVYDENSRSNAINYNHRFNLRLEHNFDSANSIVLTPRLSFQANDSYSFLSGEYSSVATDLRRMLDNQNVSGNSGVTFSNNLVYRHRFSKRGRSLSIGINTDVNNREGDASLYSIDQDEETGVTENIDQRSDNYTKSLTLSPNITYTEPVGKRGQLQINYTPSYRKSSTDKKTWNFASETDSYSELDTLLTNSFDNIYTTQRGGVSYRFNNRKVNFNIGINGQQSRLSSEQEFPLRFSIDRTFGNILPQLTMNYKFTQTENIRIMYRTSANAPSVNQLQNVVDNRNPLFLRTGNPNLAQDFNHNLTIRYGRTNATTSSSFLFMLSGSIIKDYITNTSIIASTDTIVNDIPLSRGTQLSFPLNIDGYKTGRALITYGVPFKLIKSNLNFNAGVNYNRIPALINGQRNLASNYGSSFGAVVASNISENLDFTLSYTSNYTVVRNSLQKQSDNNYFNHNLSFRFNWIFWKGFVFNTNVTNSLYQGLSAEFDRSIWFWNAGLGYKFLKDESLEVKLNAFDILNQNNSITRDVTESYIEDRQTNVLTRYFMLTLTYRLSNFK